MLDTLKSESDQPCPDAEDESLYTFPGRNRCRKGIDFEKVDRQDSKKHYFKGQSVVPTILTVQCACAHPKLVGLVVLRECKSISAALSFVLPHFPVPPRTVWYENACNSFDCVMIRIPWFLRWSMLMVDRFNFTDHTCSNMFNANLQSILDDDRSVSAEVINAVIDMCISHIGYLEGKDIVPFMKVLFGHLNASAYVRERVGRGELENEDIGQMFRTIFVCPCELCVTSRRNAGVALGTTDEAKSGITKFADKQHRCCTSLTNSIVRRFEY